jgi:hypothetical protein
VSEDTSVGEVLPILCSALVAEQQAECFTLAGGRVWGAKTLVARLNTPVCRQIAHTPALAECDERELRRSLWPYI